MSCLPLPKDALNETNRIVLRSFDNQNEFSGQIVYTKELKKDYYKLGIELKYSREEEVTNHTNDQTVNDTVTSG